MSVPLRTLVRVAVAGVLMVVGLTASSTTARGECGDHVLVLGKAGDAPPPALPCHGPNCSTAPTAPPVTAATTVPPVPQDWGDHTVATALDFDPNPSAVVADSATRPVRRPVATFHPPPHV